MENKLFLLFLLCFVYSLKSFLPEKISIQRATGNEVEKLQELLTESVYDTYQSIFSAITLEKMINHSYSTTRLRQDIIDPHKNFFTIYLDTKLIGTVTVIVDKEILTLKRFYLHPHYQRQGIGSFLLKKLTEIFPHAFQVHLEIEERNIKALNFYIKHNFAIQGKREEFFNEPIKLLMLQKNLKNN